MVVYSSVEYTSSGSLPYILLFTLAFTRVWFDVTVIDINTLLLQYYSGYVGVWLGITHGDY